MGSRMVLAMVAAIAIVAVGGIGFAAFTANAYVNGTAGAGYAEVHFSGAYSTVVSGQVICSAGFSSSGDYLGDDNVMTITASEFAPGDYCTVTESAVNGGTVGETVTSSGAAITGVSGGDMCGGNEWTTYDNAYPGENYGSYAPGGSFSVSVTIELNSNAGNECQGATASFSDTLTGTSYA